MEELEDAIWYFEEQGFIDELTSDKRHYVQVLIDYAKNTKDKCLDQAKSS